MNSLAPVCPLHSHVGSLKRLRIGIMPATWMWLHWREEEIEFDRIPESVEMTFDKETAMFSYTSNYTTLHGFRRENLIIEAKTSQAREKVFAFFNQFIARNVFVICEPADGTAALVFLPLKISVPATTNATYTEVPVHTLQLLPRGLTKTYVLKSLPPAANPNNPTDPTNPTAPKKNSFNSGFSSGFQ